MKPIRAARARCKGVTLIELMVSLVLGLVITISVINAYLGSSRAAQVADAQARMNDDAGAVLALLAAHVRMAGSNPERPLRPAEEARNPAYAAPGGTAFAIRSCDGGFGNASSAAKVDDLTCATTATGPDAVAVTYEADTFNTAGLEAAGIPKDCMGRPLPPVPATVTMYDPVSNVPGPVDIQYYVGESRFYVAFSADGVPRLLCRGNGIASQPGVIAENVEDLQFSFGVAPPAATAAGNIAGYLSASEMATNPALASMTEAQRWARVVSVRVCVLMRSGQSVVHDLDSARYFNCEGALVSAPDRRLRRTYRSTIVLRGRA